MHCSFICLKIFGKIICAYLSNVGFFSYCILKFLDLFNNFNFWKLIIKLFHHLSTSYIPFVNQEPVYQSQINN